VPKVTLTNPFVIEDFRQVYEAVALPVLIVDHATWRVLGVNASALEQYGYTREEFVGLPVLEVRPPEGRADARRVMSEIPHGFWKTTVVQHMRKDGSVFSADVWSRDTVVDGRNVRIATIHEVTERLQIQQELQQAQKMEVVGRLAGGVAHDFNNALTAITGGLNLLLEDYGNVPDTRNQIEAILSASQRVALLTRGLMAFSRQQVMRVELCSLGAVVQRSVDLLGHGLGRHIELRTRFVPDTWAVRVDPVQLEQVIMNLAMNAQDAMPGGGSLVVATENVSVSREEASSDPSVPAGDYAVLSVEDTGKGMDEITRARVFEPFFTTKPPPEGTGLGLSVSYGIVRQSGGFIRVESAPGEGTTFRILLPRADEIPDEATPVFEPAEGGGRTVLVVDGDSDVRRFTCRVLRGLGYRAVPSASASEALATLTASEEIPVLLVASLGLPGRGGEELADRLQEANPGLGVVFLSSSDLEGDRLRAVSGGRQLLPRSFSVGTLTEAVRRVLNDS
jgi:two-component system, cell cycle sensor histidine kinase and response regulator CckA